MRSVKFLFLPAEHDPDSFIREFGKDAFSRYISEATPLSRFLIDSARDGCDLNTAEGRAHMASNAKPLWMQLPDGALKRQLLTEIADLVQLASRELTDLWMPAAAARLSRAGSDNSDHYKNSSYSSNPYEGYSPKTRENHTPRPRPGGRTLPASRADHAVRLMLGNMAAWETLSGNDHVMLCELPEPHGSLFMWLESQLHEHGPQPWGALREAIQGLAFEPLSTKLMSSAALDPLEGSLESGLELRNLLDLMLADSLRSKESEASKALETNPSDPIAQQYYRDLQIRRRELETAALRKEGTTSG